MTGLVLLVTGAWNARVQTEIPLSGGDLSWIASSADGAWRATSAPDVIAVRDGEPQYAQDGARLAWHEVAVERFFIDREGTIPFSGEIRPGEGVAIDVDGRSHPLLFGPAVENAGPLTMLAFERGLPGTWGRYIVILSILLFAISTAISWSYYGDRCAYYVFGPQAVLPYKLVYVAMHFVGAVLPLTLAWQLGDVLLGIVIFPNLIALLLLSPLVAQLTRSYFERQPWRAVPQEAGD